MNRLVLKHGIALFFVFCILFSWSSIAYAQNETAELGVFENFQVSPGSSIQVPVSIRKVSNLYGVDFTLNFDPTIVKIVDDDPVTPGIQASLGGFLDPGLLLFNIADNENGTYRFTMSQYNPSEAKSGEGILVVINFTGIAVGESQISISSVELADRRGVAIPGNAVNATLSVSADAPTQAATIPVVVSTNLIAIATFTPTPTPTITPIPSKTPTALNKETEEKTVEGTSGNNPKASGSGYFLVDHWWIVLILMVIVIAFCVYFYIIKKKK